MDWGKFAEAICSDVGKLFIGSLKSYKEAAEKDAKSFLDDSKNDVEDWTIKLTEGKLAKEDYEVLINGKADVVKMLYLKQKGIGKIQTEVFIKGLIDIIISSAFKLIP